MSEECIKKNCDPSNCTGHYFNKDLNKFVRCGSRAGIFLDHAELPVEIVDIKAISARVSAVARANIGIVYDRFIKKEFPKKPIYVSNADTVFLDSISSCLLRAAISSDFKVRSVSFLIVTDWYFDSRKNYYLLYEPDILHIYLGNEIPNKSTLPIVTDIFESRRSRGKYTFFTSKTQMSNLTNKYGADFQKYFTKSVFTSLEV